MKQDIHESEKRLRQVLEKIKKSRKISKRNKELLLKFQRDCFAQGLSIVRVERYLYLLKNIISWLNKDLDKANKEDLLDLVQKIERMDYAEWTKQLHKISIKKFYKWLNNGEYPEKIKWLKTTMKNGKSRLPEEILTIEEVKRLIEAAGHVRDKALISTLYESGCRIGELATMQIKHLNFDKYGAKIIVSGKTGMRRIRLITSTPYLANWLEIHPNRDDPNSPLFLFLKLEISSNFNKPFSLVLLLVILWTWKSKKGYQSGG